MTDHMTLTQLFLHYRNNLGLGFVSAMMCVLRHLQQKDNWRSTVISALMCALVSFFIEDIITVYFGLSDKLTYAVAILIGYIGVDVLMNHLDFLRSFGTNSGDKK